MYIRRNCILQGYIEILGNTIPLHSCEMFQSCMLRDQEVRLSRFIVSVLEYRTTISEHIWTHHDNELPPLLSDVWKICSTEKIHGINSLYNLWSNIVLESKSYWIESQIEYQNVEGNVIQSQSFSSKWYEFNITFYHHVEFCKEVRTSFFVSYRLSKSYCFFKLMISNQAASIWICIIVPLHFHTAFLDAVFDIGDS